jgi:hypothetical protein
MDGSQTGETTVTVLGKAEGRDQAAITALCAAVERAVKAHRPSGFKVREVVVMLEEGSVPNGAPEAAPVYVDVYDSGYGHGI